MKTAFFCFIPTSGWREIFRLDHTQLTSFGFGKIFLIYLSNCLGAGTTFSTGFIDFK